jgi:hypothetical protein
MTDHQDDTQAAPELKKLSDRPLDDPDHTTASALGGADAETTFVPADPATAMGISWVDVVDVLTVEQRDYLAELDGDGCDTDTLLALARAYVRHNRMMLQR